MEIWISFLKIFGGVETPTNLRILRLKLGLQSAILRIKEVWDFGSFMT